MKTGIFCFLVFYDLLTYKDETDIQNTLRTFLEKDKFGPIAEELFLDKNSPLQKHQYVLIDTFLKYVEILNVNLWSSELYKESKEQIIDIIKNHFLSKFDLAKTNQEIYHLIFGRDTRTITLTKLDGKKDDLVGYIVQRDDTLWNIAQKYKSNMEQIKKLNNISNSKYLKRGVKIKIPVNGS